MQRLIRLKLSLSLALPMLALAPVTGCAGSVSGEVDGESVATLLSALFVEIKSDTVDGDGDEAELTSISAGATSLLDACAGATKRQLNTNALREQFLEDAIEDADEDALKDAADAFAQGIVDYEVENVPTDYWTLSVGAASIDDGEISGGKAEVQYDEAPEIDDIRGSLSLCRVNDHPSVDEDDNDFAFVEQDADCWSAIEADIEIVKWEEEAAFEAKATATLGDFEDFIAGDEDEPKDVGDVEISISASHCPTLQEAIEEAADIEEEALEG
jgi:hypothetical protein